MSLMLPTVPAAPLLLGLLAQGGASRADGWELHNTVDAIVEGQIITRQQVLESIYEPDSEYKISSLEDLARAQQREIDLAVQHSLRVQAGEAMGGGSDDRLDDHIRRVVAQQKREMGLFEYQDYLSERELDPESNHLQLRSDLHASLWEQSVTGVGASASGRKTRDLFLRPGQLRILYEEGMDQLRDPPPGVRFQMLVVQSSAAGGLENARAVCEEQRQLIEDGKPFELAVEEYGAELRESGGDTGWVDLTRIGLPRVLDYLKGAEIGDLSAVLDAVDPRTGAVIGAQVLMLLERDPGGEPADFADPRIQRHLRRVHDERIRDRLLRRAEWKLTRQAYIWRRGR